MKKSSKKKNVYIVLTQTNTILAKIIKIITGKVYSHVSLSFNPNCLKMYSFGRKYYNNPLYGIFKIENIHDKIFRTNKKNLIAIYSLEVTFKEYRQIKRNIRYINKINKGYNILGLILAIFNLRIKRKKYYCSEFVYDALSRNTNLLKIKNTAINPQDIITLNNNIIKIYEGKIQEFLKINNIIQS
jgi:hypothetical protein